MRLDGRQPHLYVARVAPSHRGSVGACPPTRKDSANQLLPTAPKCQASCLEAALPAH